MNSQSQQFELRQIFRIESARFLPNLPESHPCRRMHGHSFQIELRLISTLDEKIGWVQDYHEIEQIMKPLLQELDHRVLNEVKGLENPTSELLAKWIFERAGKSLPTLKQVSIKETPNTECRYPVL